MLILSPFLYAQVTDIAERPLFITVSSLSAGSMSWTLAAVVSMMLINPTVSSTPVRVFIPKYH
jgi:hypothetical protein